MLTAAHVCTYRCLYYYSLYIHNFQLAACALYLELAPATRIYNYNLHLQLYLELAPATRICNYNLHLQLV